MKRLAALFSPTLANVIVIVSLGSAVVVVIVYDATGYIANARSAEARVAVGAIAKGNFGGMCSMGAAQPTQVCDAASVAVPPRVDLVRGRSFQSTDDDWRADSGRPGSSHVLDGATAAVSL